MSEIVAALAGAVVAVIVTTVVLGRRWRLTVREGLSSALSRVSSDPPVVPDSSVDAMLTILDRTVREVSERSAAVALDADRLRAALDGVPHAVLVFDADGNVVDANVAAAPFLQARHGDALVGAAVGSLVADAAGVGAASTTIELFGPPRRVVEVVAVRLGAPVGVGVVATVGDVTDRRHLEEVRTDLVANLSHELKTPVGAICLLAETIDGETDPDALARLSGRIHVEAMRLAATVDDLLDLSRIESIGGHGGGEVDLAEVIDEVVDRLGAPARRAGVEVRVDPVGPGRAVPGDRVQLVSAVANLVDNAVKYSDPGSTVHIAAGVTDGEARIVVTDEGIGIPTRDLDRIFERFYRVDQARSRGTGGSGLGLSIVRHVVANHGGRLDVRSRLGEGSTFTMTLPTATSTAMSSTPSTIVVESSVSTVGGSNGTIA